MIAVIFELIPKAGMESRYFDHAATLGKILPEMEGFISVERFESLVNKGKYLSLSFWRDEAAVKGWRERMEHRGAQADGRAHVFEDYRLRVAHVVRDYGLNERSEAPVDSKEAHPHP
ncbi:antibiotic biosynthesis monooxygenase family protein [Kordiimonas sp.]|uniref:antibiotic biosynthesis monooxygenase family protein n=1 Tax=Kordiimonas sp. TaxID=1970157 RepID=UPI003A8CB9FA